MVCSASMSTVCGSRTFAVLSNATMAPHAETPATEIAGASATVVHGPSEPTTTEPPVEPQQKS